MIKALLVAALAVTLAGCASTPTIPATVYVPVAASCPVPELPIRPSAAALLSAAASNEDKARGIATYLQQLSGYADALEALLLSHSNNMKDAPQ